MRVITQELKLLDDADEIDVLARRVSMFGSVFLW